MRTRSAIAVPLLLVVALAGCKGSAKPAAVGPQSTSGTITPAAPTPTPAAATTAASKPLPSPGTDPCTLLTPAIAAQALGAGSHKKPDSGSTSSTKRCEYGVSGGAQTFAGVGISTKPWTLAAFQQLETSNKCTAMTGFGDAAYLCPTIRTPSTVQDLYLAVHGGSTLMFISNDPLDAKYNPLPGAQQRTIALAHLLLG